MQLDCLELFRIDQSFARVLKIPERFVLHVLPLYALERFMTNQKKKKKKKKNSIISFRYKNYCTCTVSAKDYNQCY